MDQNVRWVSVIRGAGCIIALASLAGIAANVPFLVDVLKGEKTYDAEARIQRIVERSHLPTTSLSQAKEAFDHHSVLFVDSRSEEDFTAGHIPGAINIPWEEFELNAAECLQRIPASLPLIIYCGGGCESSAELAEALSEMGYSEVSILVNGWPSWVEAGYSIESWR